MSDRTRLALLVVLAVLVASACATNKRLAEQGRRGFKQLGVASWYGPGFHGKRTANGEVYDMHGLTAAHKQLPFETVVEVRNHDNGKRVRVRINDRGPFVRGRIIDLSRGAAERIGLVATGVARVTVTVVDPAPVALARSDRSTEWTVQAGAFSDRGRAEEHLQRVRSIDRRAWLTARGEVYRILIGPLDRESEARRVLDELRSADIEAILRRSASG